MVASDQEFLDSWKSLKDQLGEGLASFPDINSWNPSKVKGLSAKKKEAIQVLGKALQQTEDDKSLKEYQDVLLDAANQYASKTKTTQASSSPSGEDVLTCPVSLDKSKMGITFENIAGNEVVKNQMRVNYIYPFVYQGLFSSVAKGTLLYGTPGGGKTLMAKAATAELPNAVFFAPSPAEIKGKYLGETEKNIHKVFECADNAIKSDESGSKKGEIAIIFFDEFESIGSDRQLSEGMSASVNTLLQEMDGIMARPNVSVLAATNYPWVLDSAILRRFPTRIFVDLPDAEAVEFKVREALAQAYSSPSRLKKNGGKIPTKEFYAPETQGKFPLIVDLPGGYMANIKEYGYTGYTNEIVPGYLKNTTIQIPDKLVSDSFVKTLVKMLGPSDKGISFLKEWNEGKKLDCSDPRVNVNEPIFGYSPSDISTIMKTAINGAALRALTQSKCKLIGVGGEEEENKYWVASGQFEEKGKASIKVQNKARIITFDIRESDVLDAIKHNGSTIKNKEYFRLLHYSKYKGTKQDIEDVCPYD